MAIAASLPLKAELNTLRRSSRNIKRELVDSSSPLKPPKPSSPTPRKRIKTEHHSPKPESSPSKKPAQTPKAKPKDKDAALQSKKLSAYSFTRTSPFPNFPHPMPAECSLALSILSSLHGARSRPTTTPKASSTSAGCGASPSVLDALVRTILSQNTSDRNSSRAKLSMDAAYSRSDNWAAIVQGDAQNSRTPSAREGSRPSSPASSSTSSSRSTPSTASTPSTTSSPRPTTRRACASCSPSRGSGLRRRVASSSFVCEGRASPSTRTCTGSRVCWGGGPRGRGGRRRMRI
uniref:Uncharacterized protein n=1 Tax=Bionectria ochroleuca TaxID=29856 RepID=A0A8H7N5H6_BIOOC